VKKKKKKKEEEKVQLYNNLFVGRDTLELRENGSEFKHHQQLTTCCQISNPTRM
jgi:hypothetical protein